METIIKDGIEYQKDTSYSDKIYNATWTDNQSEVVVSGIACEECEYGVGFRIKINGVWQILAKTTFGDAIITNFPPITITNEDDAFKIANKAIKEFIAEGTDKQFDRVITPIAQINKKQEMALLDIFGEVLRNDEEPLHKYSSAIIIHDDGGIAIASVDHWDYEQIHSFKIEDYEKVFEILRNK